MFHFGIMKYVGNIPFWCYMCNLLIWSHNIIMDRLQTNGELQDKTSFIDPSTGVGLLKGCSPDYLLL